MWLKVWFAHRHGITVVSTHAWCMDDALVHGFVTKSVCAMEHGVPTTARAS